METLQDLLDTLPQRGRVRWLGVRPARRAPMVSSRQVRASVEAGLEGDRYGGRPSGKRQVTLMQQEHLPVVAACVGGGEVLAEALRRNVIVSGINLLALKDRAFRIGDAVLQGTGPCAPCSFMEEVLGPGGYNAMRGHGGICARVLVDGAIRVGDPVQMLPRDAG